MSWARQPVRAALAAFVGLGMATSLAMGSGVSAASPTPDVPLTDIANPFVIRSFTDFDVATGQQIMRQFLPSNPFYREPQGATDHAPGTLLKSLPVQVQVSGVRPNTIEAYKIMYTFTNQVTGAMDVSTGLVMIPKDGKPNRTKPIINYNEAIDSVGSYCGASTQWTGADQLDGALVSALGPAAMMFQRGQAIVMTDVGNDGASGPRPFSALGFSAPASLDAVRAATQIPQAGLSLSAPVGIFGIAGGGSIAARAAEIAPTYAPELNVRGAVLEGMAPYPARMERVSDGGIGAGFAFANILGLAPAYPEMQVEQHLSPLGRAIAAVYNQQCQFPAYFSLPFLRLSLLFDQPIPSEIPSFKKVYEENELGHAAPRAPVLIASCSGPGPMSLVPAEDARELAQIYRRGGTDVTYQPTACGITDMLTNIYKWGTDQFGMQTINWLTAKLGGAR